VRHGSTWSVTVRHHDSSHGSSYLGHRSSPTRPWRSTRHDSAPTAISVGWRATVRPSTASDLLVGACSRTRARARRSVVDLGIAVAQGVAVPAESAMASRAPAVRTALIVLGTLWLTVPAGRRTGLTARG
jgi:hypothetical protein